VLFAQVIQMLHAVLGAEQFREGLVVYMKRHQYGNTETTDLWQARPVVDAMYLPRGMLYATRRVCCAATQRPDTARIGRCRLRRAQCGRSRVQPSFGFMGSPAARSAPGLRSPLPHLHQDGLGSALPHLHRDSAEPSG
jgi:hypothetical protein